MRSLFSVMGLICSVFMLAGCGGGPSDAPTLASISGKVTVDGKPVAGLTVEFHPDKNAGNSGPMSSGLTTDDGSFILSTSTGKAGAVVGKHKVLVKCPWRLEGRAEETADGFGSSEDGSEPPAPSGEKKECTVNIKFESADTTPLSAEVPPEGADDLLLQAASS